MIIWADRVDLGRVKCCLASVRSVTTGYLDSEERSLLERDTPLLASLWSHFRVCTPSYHSSLLRYTSFYSPRYATLITRSLVLLLFPYRAAPPGQKPSVTFRQ